MNKIRVIDLLNKIANNEELPEKIKVMGATYYFCENDQSGCCYFSEKQGFGGVRLSFDTSVMNEEVEIIEEENKIEKLKDILRIDDLEPPFDENLEMIWKQTIKNQNKINEIIDKLNELGDKE